MVRIETARKGQGKGMLEETVIEAEQNRSVCENAKEYARIEIEWVKRLQESLGEEEWLRDKDCFDDEEYLLCVEDLLEHSLVQSMKKFCQHGSTTTLTHCINVSYLSYQICKKMGWDYRAAARAGLLHDFFLYDWHTHCKETKERLHGFYHPRKALNNAEREFDLTEKEKDIILKHMWPLTIIPPKSWEGMSVMYADKICTVKEMYENAVGGRTAPI